MQLQHLSLGSIYFEGQQGLHQENNTDITINYFYTSLNDSYHLGIYSARWSKKNQNNM